MTCETGGSCPPQWVPADKVEAGPYLGNSSVSSLDVVLHPTSSHEVLSLHTEGNTRGICTIHSGRALGKGLKGDFVAWSQAKQDLMRADIVSASHTHTGKVSSTSNSTCAHVLSSEKGNGWPLTCG